MIQRTAVTCPNVLYIGRLTFLAFLKIILIRRLPIFLCNRESSFDIFSHSKNQMRLWLFFWFQIIWFNYYRFIINLYIFLFTFCIKLLSLFR